MEAALVVGDGEPGPAGDVLAGVADVVEERPLDVLRHRLAEQLADQPVEGGRLAVGRAA